jgi:hypothetical protein
MTKSPRPAITPARPSTRRQDTCSASKPNVLLAQGAGMRRARETGPGYACEQSAVTVKVAVVWAVTSDQFGWFSGWRRADSETARRPAGLTGKASVARRRPRTFGVT